MAAKKDKLVSPDNQLVSTLDKEFIKNPILYTQLRGNFSLSQTNLMIAVAAQVQDRVRDYFKVSTSPTLFTEEEMMGGYVQIDIPLKSLNVPAWNYRELAVACEELLNTRMTYKSIDPETKVPTIVMQNIFHKIEIPADIIDTKVDSTRINKDGVHVAVHYEMKKRRQGFIRIKMHSDSARDLLNMSQGYTEHMRSIAQISRSPRTPRLYMYLSAWRKQGWVKVLYVDLKEFLGVMTLNAERDYNNPKTDVKKFSYFTRDVLDPVQREMEELAKANKIDFYFTYEPIRPGGAKRGNPDYILFKLINSQMGIDRLEHRKEESIYAELRRRYKIQPYEWAEIQPLMFEGVDMHDELYRVDELIEKKQPDNVHAYATKLIKTWLQEQQKTLYTEAVEVVQIPEKPTRPTVKPSTRACFDKWYELCQQTLDPKFASIFMDKRFMDIWKADSENKIVYIALPTNFVAEQWELERHRMLPLFLQIFGPDARYEYVIEDLKKYEDTPE